MTDLQPMTAPGTGRALSVLCVGEAMVELSPAEPPLWRLGFAGDTLNTAWYLRRLLPPDHAVGYMTRIGRSAFSDAMRDFIQDAGLDVAHVSRDPAAEVGLYAIHLTDGERSFSYWRGQSAARGLADDGAALDRAFAAADWIYLSGITLAILPADGRDRMLAALARARGDGARIAFDPNLRPKLWPDAPTMRQTIERAAALADEMLPSFDDEHGQFRDASPQATIDRYLAAGARQVVVKAGGDPVRFGGADGTGCVDDLRRETPVDTTAAGDSFNAGYLAARLSGRGVADAIRAGHAISRQVIRQRGALVEIGTDSGP